MKTYKLEEVQDEIIGKVGTPARDKFEYELKMDSIGNAVKESRKEKNLTQEELGKLIGVQKTQISKLEKSASNVSIETILKVFNALNAKLRLQIDLPQKNFRIEN